MEPDQRMCTRCGQRPPRPQGQSRKKPVWCQPCLTEASRVRNAAKRAAGTRFPGKQAEEQRARYKLKYAKRMGRVTPGPCAVCHQEVEVAGHHHDYDQPLNVTWLCREHHDWVHMLLRGTAVA